MLRQPIGQTGRTPTFVIAANDSADWMKAQADYVCDGVADNVEIQAAIARCGAGDLIYFTPGTFYIAATITSTAAISFYGSEIGSVWYLVDGANCNMFSGLFRSFVGMQLNGNRLNQGATSHLINFTGGSDTLISDCLLWYGNGDGFRAIDAASDWWTLKLRNVTIENMTNHAINIQQSNAARYIRSLQFHNLYIWLARDSGIRITGNSQNVHEIIITANLIGYIYDSCIELDDVRNVTISNNALDSPGGDAPNNDAGIYLNDCAEVTIGDNTITNSLALVNGYGVELQGTTDRVILESNIIRDSGGAWVGPVNLGALNVNGLIHKNVGYIARGEVRSVSGALTAGVVNAICFAWNNPEAQDILVKKVVVEVTTAGGTPGSHLDVGIADDAIGTNRGVEFFDDLDLNAAQIDDSWVGGDGGTQTKWVFCQDQASAVDDWIVGQILDANAGSLVGRYYIEYVGR